MWPILQFAGTDRFGGSPEISGLSPFHGVATDLKGSAAMETAWKKWSTLHQFRPVDWVIC